VQHFEYRKIDLNVMPRKVDEVDLLNEAGKEGWELVSIAPNHIAYLKRSVATKKPVRTKARDKAYRWHVAPGGTQLLFLDVPKHGWARGNEAG
jgi:hypothetical protein